QKRLPQYSHGHRRTPYSSFAVDSLDAGGFVERRKVPGIAIAVVIDAPALKAHDAHVNPAPTGGDPVPQPLEVRFINLLNSSSPLGCVVVAGGSFCLVWSRRRFHPFRVPLLASGLT